MISNLAKTADTRRAATFFQRGRVIRRHARSTAIVFTCVLLGSYWAQAGPATAAEAGSASGSVTEVAPNGRFFQLRIDRAEPESLAGVGETVKVMANWTNRDGTLQPLTGDVERIRGLRVGDPVELTIRRDEKQNGFRFASPEQVERINHQARVQRETMLLPEEPLATDRGRITGADLDALARMEAAIDHVIEVQPGDNVVAALNQAQAKLERGESVRVRFAAGRYPLQDHHRVKIGGGSARDPLLVIEGAGPTRTIFDFKGQKRKAPELLSINEKHNLIIRGLGMIHHPESPILVGKYAPIQDNAQFLIEDCQFRENWIGLTLFHVRGVTIRDVAANQNRRTGLFLIAVNAIIEDSRFNGNAGAGPGSFRGGIALATFDTLIRRVECNDNPGRASGIRMDHAAENIIIEDSQFNRNGKTGLFWETAAGPVDIVRSQMNDNGQEGVHLASAYHFRLLDSEVRRNGHAQVMVLTKPRPVIFLRRGVKTGAYGASDLNAGIGKQWTNLRGLMGNRFLTVRGSTLETQRQRAPIYGHKFGRPDIYRTYFTEQFIASNNTYISPVPEVFDRFQGEYSKYDLISFDQWKQWTGQERESKLVLTE